MTPDQKASIPVFNITNNEDTWPSGFLLVYPQVTVEKFVRNFAGALNHYMAKSGSLEFALDTLIVELHTIPQAPKNRSTEATEEMRTQRVNMSNYQSSNLTLKIYPSAQYAMMFEVWDEETGGGAMYVPPGLVDPEEPSRIFLPK